MKNVDDLVLEIQELSTKYSQAGRIANKITEIYNNMSDKVGEAEKTILLNKINSVNSLLTTLEQSITTVEAELQATGGSSTGNRKLTLAKRILDNSEIDSVYTYNNILGVGASVDGAYMFKTPYKGVVRGAAFNRPGYGVSNTSGPVAGREASGSIADLLGSNYLSSPDSVDSLANGDSLIDGLVAESDMVIAMQFFSGNHYVLFKRGVIGVYDKNFKLLTTLNNANELASTDQYNMYREMKISHEGLIFVAHSTYENSTFTHYVTCLNLDDVQQWQTSKILSDLASLPGWGNTNIVTVPDSPCFDQDLRDHVFIMRGSKYISKYEKYTGIEVGHVVFSEYKHENFASVNWIQNGDEVIGQLYHNGKFLWVTMGAFDPGYNDPAAFPGGISNVIDTGKTFLVDPATLLPYSDSQGVRTLDVNVPSPNPTDYYVSVGSVDIQARENFNGPDAANFIHWAPSLYRNKVGISAGAQQFVYPLVNRNALTNPGTPLSNGIPSGHATVFAVSPSGTRITSVTPNYAIKYPCYPGESNSFDSTTASRNLSGAMDPTSLRLTALQFDNKGMLVYKKCRDVNVSSQWLGTSDDANRDAIIVAGANMIPLTPDNEHVSNVMTYEFNNKVGTYPMSVRVWPYVPGTPSDTYS